MKLILLAGAKRMLQIDVLLQSDHKSSTLRQINHPGSLMQIKSSFSENNSALEKSHDLLSTPYQSFYTADSKASSNRYEKKATSTMVAANI